MRSWQIVSVDERGIAEIVTLGQRTSWRKAPSTSNRPVGSLTRSRYCRPCSCNSSTSIRIVQEPSGRKSQRLPVSGAGTDPALALEAASDAGSIKPMTSRSSTLPRLRCVAGENERIDSISSPKNSKRNGASASGGKTSRMPPRRLNSPGASTASAGRKPRSTSHAASSSKSRVSPTRRRRRLRARDSRSGTGCITACNVVSKSRGGFVSSSLSKRSR